MFLRQFLLHSHASRSKSSLRHAVSYSSRATGESSVLRFSWMELEMDFPVPRPQPGILSLGWHTPKSCTSAPSRFPRYCSIHLLTVLSGMPYHLPASAVVRFPSSTRTITLSQIDWLWWGTLKEWIAL
jgi:hypothetical protein